ncbi:hypothetical protein MMC30_000715 [Trapelia coarctata]|nr:hypothetical protein [Trapelia coarctata]
MPPRLPLLPTSILHTHPPRPIPSAYFHTSKPWNSDNIDPYETLQVPHNASAASIKKQFYALSSLHHPDHNPTDPTASSRFVKISEAYAILGHPDTRARYDRDHLPSTSHPSTFSSTAHSPRGSHSSSSGPYGARPASGLSKRRTQFRGPPPSFYRSGGWGAHGAKRAAAQEAAAEGARNTASGSTNPMNDSAGHSSSSTHGGMGNSMGGGFGASQSMRAGWNDVPHFDREGHLWTQEQHERRRRRRMEEESAGYERGGGGGMVWNFLFVTGVVVLAGFVPGIWAMAGTRKRRDEDV